MGRLDLTILREPDASSAATVRVFWLPADGTPPVDLGIDVKLLRWGR